MEKFKNIPVSEWNKMLKAVEKVAKNVDNGEVISEEKAAELLGIKKVTLQNHRYSGKVPARCYKQTVTGSYVYFKNQLFTI